MANDNVVHGHFAVASDKVIHYLERLVQEVVELIGIAEDVLINGKVVSIPDAPASHAGYHIGTEVALLPLTSLEYLIDVLAPLPCGSRLLARSARGEQMQCELTFGQIVLRHFGLGLHLCLLVVVYDLEHPCVDVLRPVQGLYAVGLAGNVVVGPLERHVRVEPALLILLAMPFRHVHAVRHVGVHTRIVEPILGAGQQFLHARQTAVVGSDEADESESLMPKY